MKAAVKLAGVIAVLAPVQAFAATGNIPFNGTVSDTCIITVGSSGTITPNTAFTVLGSTQPGGAPGTATILATGSGFDVFADAPSAWGTAPASASSAVFATTYSLSGANTASNVAGTTGTALSNFGTTNASVNLTATLPSGTYESGTYAATVVLRCE